MLLIQCVRYDYVRDNVTRTTSQVVAVVKAHCALLVLLQWQSAARMFGHLGFSVLLFGRTAIQHVSRGLFYGAWECDTYDRKGNVA